MREGPTFGHFGAKLSRHPISCTGDHSLIQEGHVGHHHTLFAFIVHHLSGIVIFHVKSIVERRGTPELAHCPKGNVMHVAISTLGHQ